MVYRPLIRPLKKEKLRKSLTYRASVKLKSGTSRVLLRQKTVFFAQHELRFRFCSKTKAHPNRTGFL